MRAPAITPVDVSELRPLNRVAVRVQRLNRIARWVSNATHPPIVGIMCVLLVGLASMKLSVWLWGAEYLTVAVLLPTVFVLWLVKRGEILDVQLPQRQQRIKPYCAALTCMLLAALSLNLFQAPKLLIQIGWANVLQTLVLFVVTLRWKISAHAASIAGLSVLACRLMGVSALPFVVLVPLVAWSRVRLGRHDVWQTVAGACAGSAISALALSV
jgi:membrane-associated phospholipid phosphatase